MWPSLKSSLWDDFNEWLHHRVWLRNKKVSMLKTINFRPYLLPCYLHVTKLIKLEWHFRLDNARVGTAAACSSVCHTSTTGPAQSTHSAHPASQFFLSNCFQVPASGHQMQAWFFLILILKSSAKYFFCFNIQSASMSLPVSENIVWVWNSLDLDETLSYLASHPDLSCFHMRHFDCNWQSKC